MEHMEHTFFFLTRAHMYTRVYNLFFCVFHVVHVFQKLKSLGALRISLEHILRESGTRNTF